MLPVLDAFDLAAQHFSSAPSEEAEALDQARGLLLDALAKEGLERIDEVGVEFNPQVHDAVAHVEGERRPRWSIRCCAPDTGWKGARSYVQRW